MGMETPVSSLLMIDDGDAVFFLVELEVQALDVGVGVHVGVERRLRRADFDLRTPIGFADAGHRAGIDVEDVADLVGEKANVGEVGALLGGNLLDRQLQAEQDAGDDQRNDAEERVFGDQQGDARLRRQGRERESRSSRIGP